MFKIINRKAPLDRRPISLDAASPATVLSGQVVEQDANGNAVLADGATVVAAPMWAWTASGRLDSSVAGAITVVEGPFSALVDTDGYVGTPAKDDALAVGTGANAGKLVVQTIAAVADLQAVVAYCTKAPNADGVIEFKAIR